ncbi:hypothetical protein A2U01_0036559, partial [Trifolium medium]|nr:hypothetical protein [Trifolium medium]
MGIEASVTDVWEGFGIQITRDYPDDDKTIFVRNKKLDMMVMPNK